MAPCLYTQLFVCLFALAGCASTQKPASTMPEVQKSEPDPTDQMHTHDSSENPRQKIIAQCVAQGGEVMTITVLDDGLHFEEIGPWDQQSTAPELPWVVEKEHSMTGYYLCVPKYAQIKVVLPTPRETADNK